MRHLGPRAAAPNLAPRSGLSPLVFLFSLMALWIMLIFADPRRARGRSASDLAGARCGGSERPLARGQVHHGLVLATNKSPTGSLRRGKTAFAWATPEKGTRYYFNEVLIESNLVLRLLPNPLTTATIAIEIPAAIKPYSIAVAPD